MHFSFLIRVFRCAVALYMCVYIIDTKKRYNRPYELPALNFVQ